jgi:murein DD-endopeptidase MepM/ murein hydrolase activator NlpD
LFHYSERDFGLAGGDAGGAIALTMPAFIRAARIDRPAGRRVRLRDIELAVDLGAAIGSPRWLRGIATLGALLAAVIHFAPSPAPLPGESPAAFGASAQDEMTSIGIAATAFGADSGQRLAPTDRARPLATVPERPSIDIGAILGTGDGLARLLEREGAARDDAARVTALVSQALPVADIAPGTRIALTLGRRLDGATARPIDAVSFRARLDLALAVRRDGGRLVLDRQSIPVDTTPLHVTGLVGGSLYGAARASGVPFDAIADYLRAIGPHIDIDALRPDDRFDMVLAHARAATGEVESGRLLYASLQHGGAQLQLMRWAYQGGEQWFDRSGAGARASGFTMPVAGGRITSGFGMRFHPILGFSRMHQGVDLAAPYGTPIVAASDGVVRFAGWHGGHGNFVQIAHAGGLGTGYGHMSSFVVAPGSVVRQGQLIGYVGATGLATGPHLHFEIYQNGVPVDPASASFAATTQLVGANLARFRAVMARAAALPAGGGTQVAVNQ